MSKSFAVFGPFRLFIFYPNFLKFHYINKLEYIFIKLHTGSFSCPFLYFSSYSFDSLYWATPHLHVYLKMLQKENFKNHIFTPFLCIYFYCRGKLKFTHVIKLSHVFHLIYEFKTLATRLRLHLCTFIISWTVVWLCMYCIALVFFSQLFLLPTSTPNQIPVNVPTNWIKLNQTEFFMIDVLAREWQTCLDLDCF